MTDPRSIYVFIAVFGVMVLFAILVKGFRVLWLYSLGLRRVKAWDEVQIGDFVISEITDHDYIVTGMTAELLTTTQSDETKPFGVLPFSRCNVKYYFTLKDFDTGRIKVYRRKI